MVMTGIEEACSNMEEGKPVKPHMKEVVEKLKAGKVNITNNIEKIFLI